MPRPRRILTVNAGSSSVRLEAFDAGDPPQPVGRAHFEGRVDDPDGLLAEFLDSKSVGPVDAVAHRLVHGGPRLLAAAVLDPEVEREIDHATPLAPLHNARSLSFIRAVRRILSEAAPQVVVPDTAFFADLPPQARDYALPAEIRQSHGIRRYGFHGIAHQAMLTAWQARRPPEARASDRVISLQLGSGCSVAAMRGGRPIDTSMGFSPLEGLIMATRAGDLDPGIILHLLADRGVGLDRLQTMLNRESGLLGLSGISGDMRKLMASPAAEAAAAIEAFCYRARKYVGAYLAALGGVDGILFGGGIGENAPEIRAGILAGLEFAGIGVDEAANRNPPPTGELQPPGSSVAILVVAVDEARFLAEEALRLIGEPAESAGALRDDG